MNCHISIPVTDASSIGEARRAVMSAAAAVGLNDADTARAGIVVNELTTNLVRHAKPNGGTMLLATLKTRDQTPAAIEITALDTGPGITDLKRSFEDGFSTGGTPGNGLGAVRRLSDRLEFFTAPSGTVFWSRITANRAASKETGALSSAAVSAPAIGETVCGDGWCVAQDESKLAVMIADGLGHGPMAAEAAQRACELFDADPFASPASLLEKMHQSLTSTRGAAIAIAQIVPTSGKLLYAGVGNISGTLIAPDGSRRGLFSHNGTIGHLLRKIQTFDYPWESNSLLVMHSDGLQTRWSFESYLGLVRRHPAVIAGVFYRDFRRGKDDASVVVVGSTVSALP